MAPGVACDDAERYRTSTAMILLSPTAAVQSFPRIALRSMLANVRAPRAPHSTTPSRSTSPVCRGTRRRTATETLARILVTRPQVRPLRQRRFCKSQHLRGNRSKIGSEECNCVGPSVPLAPYWSEPARGCTTRRDRRTSISGSSGFGAPHRGLITYMTIPQHRLFQGPRPR